MENTLALLTGTWIPTLGVLARAMIPAASGAEADVPVSVVTLETHRDTRGLWISAKGSQPRKGMSANSAQSGRVVGRQRFPELKVVARVEEQGSLYHGTLPDCVVLLMERLGRAVQRLAVVLRAPAGTIDVNVLRVEAQRVGLHHVCHFAIQHTDSCENEQRISAEEAELCSEKQTSTKDGAIVSAERRQSGIYFTLTERARVALHGCSSCRQGQETRPPLKENC
ncbi:hypothetical protein EYF80_001783 [Liparis tanakae]|uniref:Secreted protein n=1 Tax=Liparis tanakae TaxID=230148 RepID=A0A4Z2JC76_9TELE|nr:hypothetical protein EYF80_001783 [Liparis tanakae]